MRPLHRRHRTPVSTGLPSVTGAGYIAAVLAGDAGLVANYRKAFSADELLDEINAPISLLGRYLGYHIDKTNIEIGSALLRAAQAKDFI